MVLDLATFVAAPFCCTLLGEFGAMQERIRRRDELDAAVQDWVGKADARTVLARLDAAESRLRFDLAAALWQDRLT
ncbi:MAG: Carnitine dehydratase [Candidatus Rokubacteria bacterium]|nr:Carnitine dehydratase [Candidatus Rokubacteria bacterium]